MTLGQTVSLKARPGVSQPCINLPVPVNNIFHQKTRAVTLLYHASEDVGNKDANHSRSLRVSVYHLVPSKSIYIYIASAPLHVLSSRSLDLSHQLDHIMSCHVMSCHVHRSGFTGSRQLFMVDKTHPRPHTVRRIYI
jgi:hypothetical protein